MKIALLPLAVCSAMVCSGCRTTMEDAYVVRKNAAATIASNYALPTVWNIAAPLELGRVYEMSGNAKSGFFLTPGAETWIDRAKAYASAPQDMPVTWTQDVSGSWNVKPQLKYMGLSGSAELKNTRSVNFSMKGDKYQFIAQPAQFETYLNHPDFGPKLREKIIADTQTLTPDRYPTYWIVLQTFTAKDLSVTLHNVSSADGKIGADDAAKVATWLQAPGLTEASVQGGSSSTKDAKLVSPMSHGLVAYCVPLKAYLSGPQKGEIYYDRSQVLNFASNLKTKK